MENDKVLTDLHFDGFNINAGDQYRTPLVKFNVSWPDSVIDKMGPLFAAAPAGYAIAVALNNALPITNDLNNRPDNEALDLSDTIITVGNLKALRAFIANAKKL